MAAEREGERGEERGGEGKVSCRRYDKTITEIINNNVFNI